MLLAGLLLNPMLDHSESLGVAIEIFTNLRDIPTAARLLEFIQALIPLVENGRLATGEKVPVETALFDELLNFDFNSFSGDNSLGWLMDLQ
jgi:hypothetical protein